MKGLRIVSKANNVGKDLRTSTNLDKDILELIRTAMAESGYGQRQRSRWINEAIGLFKVGLENCSEEEQVETLSRAATLSENGAHITVVLKPEALSFIENCKVFMADREERFEDNAQSRLIHFAITYRLIKEKYL